MQKIVLFIEPNHAAWNDHSQIGNLFMNRIAIEEDGNAEILKVYYLEYTSYCYFNGQLVFNSGAGKCLILPRYEIIIIIQNYT